MFAPGDHHSADLEEIKVEDPPYRFDDDEPAVAPTPVPVEPPPLDERWLSKQLKEYPAKSGEIVRSESFVVPTVVRPSAGTVAAKDRIANQRYVRSAEDGGSLVLFLGRGRFGWPVPLQPVLPEGWERVARDASNPEAGTLPHFFNAEVNISVARHPSDAPVVSLVTLFDVAKVRPDDYVLRVDLGLLDDMGEPDFYEYVITPENIREAWDNAVKQFGGIELEPQRRSKINPQRPNVKEWLPEVLKEDVPEWVEESEAAWSRGPDSGSLT